MNYDLNKPLIEQIDKLDWPPAEHQPINCYQLSNFHLTFYGKPDIPSIHAVKSAQYVTDIYDDSSYPQEIGEVTLWDENSHFKWLDIATLSWPSGVMLKDEYAILGNSTMRLGLQRIQHENFSNRFNIIDNLELRKLLLEHENSYDLDIEKISPTTTDDYKILNFHNRDWISFSIRWPLQYIDCFCTALSDEHILYVSYSTEGFWNSKTGPTPERLNKAMEPFWDYMNHIKITEKPLSELPPGQYKNINEPTKENTDSELEW